MSDTPIYDDIRTRRPDPEKEPEIELTKRERRDSRKQSQILTDRVWEEICQQWNATR